MLSLPSTVTIGPITYEVKEETRTAIDGVYGAIFYADSRISLQPGLSPAFQEVILWHECIHAILTQAGLRDQDEQYIHAVAYGVVQALHNNPQLVAVKE